ncbi:MAG: hypothetical protein ACKV19_05450 [Verrucomicrobiales bacterium]
MKSINKFALMPTAVFAIGVILVVLTAGTRAFWPVMLVWLVVGNLLVVRLRCSSCGKRLITMPGAGGFVRGFGLDQCAHCGHKQDRTGTDPPPP